MAQITLFIFSILLISWFFYLGTSTNPLVEKPELLTGPVIYQPVEIPESIAEEPKKLSQLIEPPEPIAKIPAKKTETEIWQESIRDLINELREAEGIGKVRFSAMLNNNAKLKADMLVELDEYTHAVEGYNIEDFFDEFRLKGGMVQTRVAVWLDLLLM